LEYTCTLLGISTAAVLKKFLTEDSKRCRERFLEFTIPYACLEVNNKESYSIGKYLHYDKMKPNGEMFSQGLQYILNADSELITSRLRSSDMPPYLLCRSYKESNRAFLSGELIQYSATSGKQLFNPNTAAVKIQSVSRGFLARKHSVKAKEDAVTSEQEGENSKAMRI